jgi:hypothetical protein
MTLRLEPFGELVWCTSSAVSELGGGSRHSRSGDGIHGTDSWPSSRVGDGFRSSGRTLPSFETKAEDAAAIEFGSTPRARSS